jgi:hypothetical protein
MHPDVSSVPFEVVSAPLTVGCADIDPVSVHPYVVSVHSSMGSADRDVAFAFLPAGWRSRRGVSFPLFPEAAATRGVSLAALAIGAVKPDCLKVWIALRAAIAGEYRLKSISSTPL